ncbi:hypothetical protein [Pseudokineococcus sp. 1T1Z-3]|uniref:hypothetical protein n=1 Tax=Pseudokineococcus sp. 1T1Z-3 TaxID=3132745 RepID=UPI00309E8AD5
MTGQPMPALARPVGGSTLLVAAVVVTVAALLGGDLAALSAAVGASVAPVFLGLTLLAARLGRDAGPQMLMALCVSTYLVKFVATALALALLQRQPWVEPTWVAASVLACAGAWLVGHVVATWRHRGLVEAPA